MMIQQHFHHHLHKDNEKNENFQTTTLKDFLLNADNIQLKYKRMKQ